jgi:predicted transport protein
LSDLKLFRVEPNRNVVEIPGSAVALERSLQTLIEQNLEAFLGVQLLASEFSTGPRHGGRVDTLGIDENGCPIIIEYKRATNENVINQGLFYLDWLMDHKAEFKLLVMEKLGVEQAASIDWTAPRLLCIAGDFNRYDEHAVQQINRNIELVRYRRYGDELLLLELVNRKTAEIILDQPDSKSARRGPARDTTVTDYLAQANPALADRYEALKAYLLALGDDVQLKTLKNYFAFRRLKNFACVEVHNRTGGLLVYVKVNLDEVELENGFTRDMRNIGHFGTGDLEIRVSSDADLERAKPLLEKSYEVS